MKKFVIISHTPSPFSPWGFESEVVYDFLIRKPQLVPSLSLTASNFFGSRVDINLLTQRDCSQCCSLAGTVEGTLAWTHKTLGPVWALSPASDSLSA